ncbi:MAG: AAA family ATPase, partial [bacterium]|nr:AAA family ATPase [bacterium]
MDTIKGVINRVVFRNDDNGYTVVSLFIETMGGWDTTAVGVFPEVHPEMRVRLTGEWTKHPKFGKQFKVQEASIILPTTEEGIEAYLASGLIRDVGPVSARLIVEVFGADTLRILDEEPERLREVKGIGPTRAANVVESWQEHRNISELMMFLQGHGITTGLAIKIYKTYGANAVQVVQQNPYRLTEIAGVGFIKADHAARAMGFAHDAPERVRAGVLYTLREQSSRAGHVFTPQPELVAKAAALLGVASALVENEISFLERSEKKIVVDGSDVYLKPYHEAEMSVAGRIRLLTVTGSPIRDEITNNVLAKAVQGLSITLSPEQRMAVETTLTNKVTVLTGGPGTGKTTVAQAIIQALDAIGRRYALCAPTGRAAKRLTEATGREALTIHRLLEYNPREEERFG